MFFSLSSEPKRRKFKELNHHKDVLFKVKIPFLLLLFPGSDHMRIDSRAGVREVRGIFKVYKVKASETHPSSLTSAKESLGISIFLQLQNPSTLNRIPHFLTFSFFLERGQVWLLIKTPQV